VKRDRPDAARDALDRRDDLLAKPVEEDRVADLDELRRHEAPLIVAADQDRVLRSALHATVEDHEALVRAELDLSDRLGAAHDAVEPPRRKPVVLGAIVDVDDETGDLE